MKLNFSILLLCILSGKALFSQKTIVIADSSIQRFSLTDEVKETSGLIYWNELLWTHNDDNDNNIYGINPFSGEIEQKITIQQLKVIDWEEIQHDENYLYIGDFGNNYKGNRTDLRIFKLLKHSDKLDTISFNYPEQTDFSVQKPNNTNFDCEAFLVTDSMIYLFTKEWNSQQTTLYKIPNTVGKHEAHKVSSFNSKGLISGATFNAEKTRIVLTGYSKTLSPFLFILSDFQKDDFFSGNQQRLKINKRFLQIESVAFISSEKIAVTNEAFQHSLIDSPQQLFLIDLIK